MSKSNQFIQQITGQQRQSALQLIELFQSSYQPQSHFIQLCNNHQDKNALMTAVDSLGEEFLFTVQTRISERKCKQNEVTNKHIQNISKYFLNRYRFIINIGKHISVKKPLEIKAIRMQPYCLMYISVLCILNLFTVCSTTLQGSLQSKGGCSRDIEFVHTEFITQANEIYINKLGMFQYMKQYWRHHTLELDINRVQKWYCDISYYYILFILVITGTLIIGFGVFVMLAKYSQRFKIYFNGQDIASKRLITQNGKLRLVEPPHKVFGQNQIRQRRYFNNYVNLY